MLESLEHGGVVEARYAWLAEPDVAAGELVLETGDERIAKLVVTFDRDVAWS
ncbi:MAG: hypothetical protein M3540_05690 [Actinomycetota bacterium]|nr:hypothetical protein [Actinomycetota bacterium]